MAPQAGSFRRGDGRRRGFPPKKCPLRAALGRAGTLIRRRLRLHGGAGASGRGPLGQRLRRGRGVLVARLLPTLASPFVGVLADRLDRRAVLIAGDLVRAILVFGLIFVRDLPAIYALVFLLGAAQTVFNPTVRAAFPSVVGGGDLTRANALIPHKQHVELLRDGWAGAQGGTRGFGRRGGCLPARRPDVPRLSRSYLHDPASRPRAGRRGRGFLRRRCS